MRHIASACKSSASGKLANGKVQNLAAGQSTHHAGLGIFGLYVTNFGRVSKVYHVEVEVYISIWRLTQQLNFLL